MEMFVVKRNGEKVALKLDKVQKRIKDLSNGLNVNSDQIAVKAIERMYDGIESREIDKHLALITVNNNIHYHYNILAGRISVSSLHKETAIDQLLEGEKEKLLELMKTKVLPKTNKLIQRLQNSLFEDEEREQILSDYLNGKKVSVKKLEFLTKAPRFFSVIKKLHGESLINKRVFDLAKKHRKEIENKIDYNRDFMFDFFGFETLKSKYLLQIKESYKEEYKGSVVTKERKRILERPQDLFMRVALAIRSDDLEKAFELYDLMSNGYYTHATPTLFNAGTMKEQMSSCFLLSAKDDSIDGIYDTLKECALISQSAGGIGLSIHNIRAKGSYIKGTGGVSNGIVPMLKVFNETARYVDQGGGKRKGSFAMYMEPWHSDVKDFLQLKKNTGADEKRARDLFTALWVPNLLGKRVREGGKWSLFDPKDVPLLYDTYGDAFERLYEQYENEGKAIEVLDAQEFMLDIFEVQIETGLPYMVNKDESNRKSNQQNLGTIRSSNLCCVSASQRVPTNKGIKTVKELYDDATPNMVVGREKIEEATQMFLPRPQAEIFTINTSDGYTHEVTKDHKVWVENFGWKEAQELKKGDKLSIQQFKGLFGEIKINNIDSLVEITLENNRKVPNTIWISDEKTVSYFVNEIIKKGENLSTDLLKEIQLLSINLGNPISIKNNKIKKMNKNYTEFESLDFKGIEDAYCLSVHSEEHSWVCNGLVTKNTEIIEYTSKDENAVCNLASVCLPKFVENGKFNHKKFHKTVQIIIENLDKVIDRNYYVDERTKRSNLRHRPVGLGVQGLADVFFKLKLPYGSVEAQNLNKEIFETMYHASITKSLELAKKDGHYPSMKENGGAPITKGILQFDMWGVTPSDRWEWEILKEEIKKYGLRNSLLVAPMPTASTSQIFYNTESFEPLTAMLYKRKVDGKEYVVVNKYMIDHFEELDLWNEKIINDLIVNDGSIQSLDYISQEVKDVYKTVWELSLKRQIDMAADRGAYICQSQSFNIHMKDPNMKKMADFYMYAFEKGLKTMSYYFRTTAAVNNAKTTINTNIQSQEIEEDDDCLVCGS